MLIRLENVLGKNELSSIYQLLGKANFIDGKLSAGMVAVQVKNNQEVFSYQELISEVDTIKY